jgi:hypothetical protein
MKSRLLLLVSSHPFLAPTLWAVKASNKGMSRSETRDWRETLIFDPKRLVLFDNVS